MRKLAYCLCLTAACAAAFITNPTGAAAPTVQDLVSLDDGDPEPTSAVLRPWLGSRDQHQPFRGFLRSTAPSTAEIYVVLDNPGAAHLVGASSALASPETLGLVHRRLAEIQLQHEALRPSLELHGAVVTAEYRRLANAMQVIVPTSSIPSILALPGVVGVHPVTHYERSNTAAVPLLGAPQLWGGGSWSLTGKGVRVGIIDTGIDYTHADFGGSGNPDDYKNNDPTKIEPGTFPTSKVVGGWDFVGDLYDGSGRTPPTPDPDPLDCASLSGNYYIEGGHGTHVAGSALGMGVMGTGQTYKGSYAASLDLLSFNVGPGVAPEASLYSLKVFGCIGTTGMLGNALEWAVDPNNDGDFSDHLDVINASLGTAFGISGTFEESMVTKLAKLGTVVVMSAGNEGDTFFVAGSPATYAYAISAAASTKPSVYLGMTIETPASIAGDISCLEAMFSKPLSSLGGPVEGNLVYAQPHDACSPITNTAEMTGKIAFIDRGTCSFVSKFQAALAAGAIAAVIVDNTNSVAPFRMYGTTPIGIPGVLIRQADGTTIKGQLTQGVKVKLQSGHTITASAGDLQSRYSSRGPRATDLLLKPDVAAPGNNVESAAVGTGTGVFTMTGTSMASPFITGGAALLRQAHPDWPSVDIKALLINSAKPLKDSTGQYNIPVSKGGSGRMQLDKAIRLTTTAAASSPEGAVSMSFGSIVAAEPYSDKRTVVLTNHGNTATSYTVSVSPTLVLSGVTLTPSPSQVTVPPKGTATVDFTLSVDPSTLPAEKMDPASSPTTRNGEVRQFLVEASGRAVFTPPSPNDGDFLLVPYYAAVRAGANRQSSLKIDCSANADNSVVSIPITGTSAHPTPLISAFELVAENPENDTRDPLEKMANLRAVGVATNLDTAGSFDQAVVMFGIAVSGEWTTPAMGALNVVAVGIDTNLDGKDDFTLVPEAYGKAAPFADVLLAALYNRQGVAVGSKRYVSVLPRDELNAEPYNNSVLVLPAGMTDLGLLPSASKFAFSVYTHSPLNGNSVFDYMAEYATYDPQVRVIDTAKGGNQGLPYYLGDAPVSVSVNLDAKGDSPLPRVLLLHHMNVQGKRWEIVDLAAAGVGSPPTDLAATQAAAATAQAGALVPVHITVVNNGPSLASAVTLTGTYSAGAVVESATPSQGTCAMDAGLSCDLGDMAAGDTVTVDLQLRAKNSDIKADVQVTAGRTCDSVPGNNKASSTIAIVSGGADVGVPALTPATVEGGGCQCRAATQLGSRQHAQWVAWGLLGLFAWRRRNDRSRTATRPN